MRLFQPRVTVSSLLWACQLRSRGKSRVVVLMDRRRCGTAGGVREHAQGVLKGFDTGRSRDRRDRDSARRRPWPTPAIAGALPTHRLRDTILDPILCGD